VAGDLSTPVAMMNAEVERQQTIPVSLIEITEQFGTESVRKTYYPFFYELSCVR
jgi:hypothetical protein